MRGAIALALVAYAPCVYAEVTVDNVAVFTRSQSRVAADQMIQCTAAESPALTRALVLSAEFKQLRRDFPDIFSQRCMLKAGPHWEQIRFSPSWWFQSAADALVRMDYPKAREFDFSKIPPLSHFEPEDLSAQIMKSKKKQDIEKVQYYVRSKVNSAYDRFGECVARHSPARSQALLLTPLESVEENAALAALAPDLSACVDGDGLELRKEALRRAIALNFYRLAGAPAGAEVEKLETVH